MSKDLNRSAINRALAKAMAFQACGRADRAEAWSAELVRLLECQNILTPSARALATSVDQVALADGRSR